MNSNKKILIKKFLSLHYSNLEYSPKRMMYYKEGNVYFEYQPKDEIIFLTLPTPKQEQYARLLKKNNNNFYILCVGGALEMLSGEESVVPRFLEYYFESFWRLKTDFKRRLYRLINSLYTVVVDVILTRKYKNINVRIYK